ncbi:MAG: helix-turn-helix domain-containing protein [Acidithiobacillus sp.]
MSTPAPSSQPKNRFQPSRSSTDADLRLYSYADVAQLLSCAPQTIYNGVSSGRFPRPLKTGVGLRFTAAMIQQIIVGDPPPVPAQPSPPVKRSRGRPRIAAQASTARSMGGAA